MRSPAVTTLPPVAGMVEFYLPLLVMAGDYARAIQPLLGTPATKTGHNRWVQAITAADPSVQGFLEVATLARYPGVGFYGEEQEQSHNAHFFPADAGTTVWLDPIDGTYLFQNQRPGWEIIVSISRGPMLMAAISYRPVLERFFLAIRGQGAFTGGRNARQLADLKPLTTRTGSSLCATYQAVPELQRLKNGFAAFDIVEEDDPARPFDNLTDLFTGRLDAFASGQADLLDWGAIAFIAAEAGGVVSTLDGHAFSGFDNFGLRSTDLLVGTSPAVHARLLAALRR